MPQRCFGALSGLRECLRLALRPHVVPSPVLRELGCMCNGDALRHVRHEIAPKATLCSKRAVRYKVKGMPQGQGLEDTSIVTILTVREPMLRIFACRETICLTFLASDPLLVSIPVREKKHGMNTREVEGGLRATVTIYLLFTCSSMAP